MKRERVAVGGCEGNASNYSKRIGRCLLNHAPQALKRPIRYKTFPVAAAGVSSAPALRRGRGKMAELGKKYCVYCLAEVSSLRFRCTECADIELCPECFSAGAEIGPHRRWHGYQLVDGGRFTLWGAEAEGGWSSREEQLLLDAIEQFGFGNWVRRGARVFCKPLC